MHLCSSQEKRGHLSKMPPRIALPLHLLWRRQTLANEQGILKFMGGPPADRITHVDTGTRCLIGGKGIHVAIVHPIVCRPVQVLAALGIADNDTLAPTMPECRDNVASSFARARRP